MFRFLLNLFFPPHPLVYELEAMPVATLAKRATHSEGRPGPDVFPLFAYHDPLIRRAVWELKYRGNTRIARLLAAALYDEILGYLEEYGQLAGFVEPLLVPIPLSPKRQRERGFNQCELLVCELERLDGGRNFTVSNAPLAKVKETKSQTKTDTRRERFQNLSGCFSARSDAVRGRTVILIDDVSTTGATLAEARETLLRAGARNVVAFTVAH